MAATPSNLDHILLVVVRILDEVAYRRGIGGLLLREVLQHLELLVADLGDMNVEHAMMRRRVDRDLAGRRVDADAGLQRLDYLDAVDAAGLLHRFRPETEALVGSHRKLGDVGIIGAEAL